MLRHQSGANFARTATIAAPTSLGLIATSTGTAGTTADVEPMNANREDNIWVYDVRAEKNFSFTDRIRLRAHVDFFNITNSHASETITRDDPSHFPFVPRLVPPSRHFNPSICPVRLIT